MRNYLILLLSLSINFVVCRDFYVGMFRKNDILVAQDRLYKERVPYRIQYAKYGRHFKCAITYFRVVDRLGYGKGPKVIITRGGLRHKYIVLRIQSMYNQPISVNIYVGCENRMPKTTRPRSTKAEREDSATTNDGNSTDEAGDSTVVTTDDGGNATTTTGSEGSSVNSDNTTTTATEKPPA